MKKFKLSMLLVAIVVAAAGIFAFTLPVKKAKKFSTYHYTSNSVDMEELQKASNWLGSSPEEGCDVNGSIPCTISTDEDLQDYLNSFEYPADLITAASSRRD